MGIGPVYHYDSQLTFSATSQTLPDQAFVRNKTLANFLRIVKVGVGVALILLARYNVQSNAEQKMT